MSFDLLNQFQGPPPPHPLTALPREDLDLITELVLKSGSLKDLASHYGISYPTIRTRLDKVIDRLSAIKAGKSIDPFHQLLATLIERGELSISAAHAIKNAASKQPSPPGPPIS